MREGPEPDMEQAREMALMAHSVVIKLKTMGLPDSLDSDLASLSTDLGDIWSAQKSLTDGLEGLLKSSHDWEAVGDHLVDIRASIDHIAWHLKSVRRPLNRITRFAYRPSVRGEYDTSNGSY